MKVLWLLLNRCQFTFFVLRLQTAFPSQRVFITSEQSVNHSVRDTISRQIFCSHFSDENLLFCIVLRRLTFVPYIICTLGDKSSNCTADSLATNFVLKYHALPVDLQHYFDKIVSFEKPIKHSEYDPTLMLLSY